MAELKQQVLPVDPQHAVKVLMPCVHACTCVALQALLAISYIAHSLTGAHA